MSLYSLLKNNPERNFRVFIICDQEDGIFRSRITSLPGNLASLTFVLSSEHFDDAPTTGTLPKAAYYRLLIGRFIPEDIDRLFYLDCDTVVTKPIDEFLDMDLGENLLAAAPNKVKKKKCLKHRRRLGLPENVTYFNSGVLLINMNKWRDLGAEQRCRSFIDANHSRILLADQDVLNPLFHDRVKIISDRFNYFGRGESATASIIHYAGSAKPWPATSRNLCSVYWSYRQLTPYAIRKTAGQIAGEYLHRSLSICRALRAGVAWSRRGRA